MASPPISEKWVPLWPLSPPPATLPPSINGRWLKGGVGGAMSWEVIPGLAADADTGWHIFGAAGEPGFQNGWQHYPDPYGPGRFRKLASGVVIMEGLIYQGTLGAVAFTMPVGYRPQIPAGNSDRDLIFQLAHNPPAGYEAARLYASNGNFRPSGGTGAAGWISLTGVIYYAG